MNCQIDPLSGSEVRAPGTVGVRQPVLLVEDDDDTRDMLATFLLYGGFSVCTAVNGLDAMSRLEHARPCLILLDLSMPVMDGLTFAHRLRQHPDPQLAATPIVLLTALWKTDDALAETGAIEVIAKPIALEDVTRVVERYCRAV